MGTFNRIIRKVTTIIHNAIRDYNNTDLCRLCPCVKSTHPGSEVGTSPPYRVQDKETYMDPTQKGVPHSMHVQLKSFPFLAHVEQDYQGS